MHVHQVIQPVAPDVAEQAVPCGRDRLESVDPAGRPDARRGEEGEVAEVRPAVDEVPAGPEQPGDPPCGVELVHAEGHATIGVDAQVQVQGVTVDREGVPPAVARPQASGHPGEAEHAAAGRRDVAVGPEGGFGEVHGGAAGR